MRNYDITVVTDCCTERHYHGKANNEEGAVRVGHFRATADGFGENRVKDVIVEDKGEVVEV